MLFDRGKMEKVTEQGNVSLHNKIREARDIASHRTKKKISNNLDYIEHTIEFAFEGGFKYVSTPNLDFIQHPIKFTRIDISGDEENFEIYLTTLTIRTNIVHPKTGKNQGYRLSLPLGTVKQILTNITDTGKGLRLHTNNLYRTRKRRKDLEKKRRNKYE